MCQLLGMNSSKPVAPRFSFEGFAERSGRTGEHKDGWGIALHGAEGCTLLTDQLAALDSPLAASLKHTPIKARNVVAHIRKATKGRIAPENTHPFTRELWGQTWSFAHNGDLESPLASHPPSQGQFAPDGETDSEHAFCYLLNGLQKRFPEGQPSRAALFAAIDALSGELARTGSLNFLLSNGQVLLARCSTHLHYLIREYPFTVAQLVDCDSSIDFGRHNHLDDRIAVVATQPLTSNEAWVKFAPGELNMFAGGACVTDALRQELAGAQARRSVLHWC